jgi:hypothetical protein
VTFLEACRFELRLVLRQATCSSSSRLLGLGDVKVSGDPRAKPDLVRKAILSKCIGDFEWISRREELRLAGDLENCGFTPTEIKRITREWVRCGGAVLCKWEERGEYLHGRDFFYWVIVEGIDEFPDGFYVELQLTDDDPEDPIVHLLNAHPEKKL